jgi:putative protease
MSQIEKENSGIWISIPQGFGIGDEVYLIQTKAMTKRYPSLIPSKGELSKRAPGRDKAPLINLQGAKKEDLKAFPEGLYVGLSRIEDLYMIQSVKPIRVMLSYNSKTAPHLLGRTDKKTPLPFSPKEIILVLDPYFPQALDKTLSEEIPELLSLGYKQFVINNPGHIAYFRGTSAVTIAGPYLYVFNRFANAFISSLGINFFINPLENNRQNLEKTVDKKRRFFTFVTIFAYPPLFRIREDLSKVYSFAHFSDSQGENFNLVNRSHGSLVLPEKPFSIIDKVPFLETAGFTRFILDLSDHPLKKPDYKDLMSSVKKASPLPFSSRFNWKDGFFSATPPANGV